MLGPMYRTPAVIPDGTSPPLPLSAAIHRKAPLWRKLRHFHRWGWNPFHPLGHAFPFVCVMVHAWVDGFSFASLGWFAFCPLFVLIGIDAGRERFVRAKGRRYSERFWRGSLFGGRPGSLRWQRPGPR